MEIKTELTNLGLIENISAEFKSGNVYFVRGGNNKGKTTFTNNVLSLLTGNAKNDTVTKGKDKGSIEGTIMGLDNVTYKVIITHKPDKNPSFTIIMPNLQKSSRKGDLAVIFGYQAVDAGTFAGWGTTESGRRKQADMFMKLMPVEIQSRIATYDAEINTKNGTLYTERRDTGIELKYIKDKTLTEPTEEQLEIFDKVIEWKTDIEKMEEAYSKEIQDRDTVKFANQELVNTRNYLTSEKGRLENEIIRLNNELVSVIDTMESLGEPKPYTISDEELVTMKQSINSSHEAMFTAAEAASYIKRYNESSETLKKSEKSYNELSLLLEKKRKDKAGLIKEHLNLKSIEIEDGLLLFKDDKGSYPINEESLSYSRIAMIVADLVLKLNPNYPIVCLGKAAEFDNKSLTKLNVYAKATNAIIVLDYVDNSGELKINVFDDIENIKS